MQRPRRCCASRRNSLLSRDYRLRYQCRLAQRDTRERRALLKPRRWCGMAPQGLALRVVERPADRRVVRIDGEVVGREQLDPMAVGVADVEEKRVGYGVAPGASFHVGEIAAVRYH